MRPPIILIAQGDEILSQNLKQRLVPYGFEVIEASDKTSALRFFQSGKSDLVIIGPSRNRNGDGLKVAGQIRQWDRKVPLILITWHSSEARVTDAMRAGGNDYFKWPFLYKELVGSVSRNLSAHKTPLSELYVDKPMIGESNPMQEIRAYLLKAASTDSTVLIFFLLGARNVEALLQKKQEE